MMTEATTREQLESCIARSGPVWLLKHSQTCGISLEAHAQVADYAAQHPDQPIAVVVVQTQRPLSNWISATFATTHQSPQLFLIHGGALVWTTSHGRITSAAMNVAVAKLNAA